MTTMTEREWKLLCKAALYMSRRRINIYIVKSIASIRSSQVALRLVYLGKLENFLYVLQVPTIQSLLFKLMDIVKPREYWNSGISKIQHLNAIMYEVMECSINKVEAKR